MRVSRLGRVVVLTVTLMMLMAFVALADTVQVDGDIVDANKDLVVAECGELPFLVDVKWSTGFHFDPGATVTVNAVPGAAAEAAGVVISGGPAEVTIPSPWQAGSEVSAPFTISAPAGTSGTYTVNISASGPSAQDPDGTLVVTRVVDLIVNVVDAVGQGFMPPINPGPPTSIFRYKSTIPVKVLITDCTGTTVPDGLTVTIAVVRVSGSTPPSGENEAASTSAADSGNLMRYAGSHYQYNLATKPLSDPTATYQITVTIVDSGQAMTAVFGLRT